MSMNKALKRCIVVAFLLGSIQIDLFSQTPTQVTSPDVEAERLSPISNYWTPERRAAANPREQLVDPALMRTNLANSPTKNEPIVSVPGAFPPGDRPAMATVDPLADQGGDATPESMTYTYPYPFAQFRVMQLLYRTNQVYPYITVGKLFFSLSGFDYVCSASVVRPHLLLTARHCVYDVYTGEFASNVVFYPGYNGTSNSSLGGAWFARRLHTWIKNGFDFGPYDIGFVQLYDDNHRGCNGSAGGKPIETYTGFLGYSYGGSYHKRQWNQFGYPHAAPFNGKVLVESESSTGAEDLFGFFVDTVEVGNSQTGGTSGGPWIRDFKPGFAGAVNYANGINSFRLLSQPLAVDSPKFFNYNFNRLLQGAQALPCK